MNDIINELLSKQIHLLSDEQTDAEIFRAIQAIDDKYILLHKTKKSVELTKNLNEMFDIGFNYTTEKMPVGLTFQELLFKAMSFQPSNPFEYIKDKCVVIPKNEDVLDYLNGVDIMYKLSGDKNPELTSNEVRLYEHKFKERNDKRFNSNFNKLFDSNKIILIKPHDGFNFQKGYSLLNFKIVVSGTEEDRRENYLNGNSPKQQEINVMLENFTEAITGRKFNITIVDKATVSRNQLEHFDGNNIFRTKQLIFEKDKYYKKVKGKMQAGSHFYCYAGLFLTYDQFCDIIAKGSLK